jgi:hypothetical protein
MTTFVELTPAKALCFEGHGEDIRCTAVHVTAFGVRQKPLQHPPNISELM